MYAINHAATALVLKRRFPSAPLVPLLIAVQLMEIGWVLLHLLGVEKISLVNRVVDLGEMPYSHSVASGVGLALLVGLGAALFKGDRRLGVALGLAVLSHLVLDLAMHKPDIALAPGLEGVRLGLDTYAYPLPTFAIELGYGVLCWWIYRGNRSLLMAIVVLNLLDLPFIFAGPMPAGMTRAVADHVTVAVVAIQMALAWWAVWRFRGQPGSSPSSQVAGGRFLQPELSNALRSRSSI